MTAWRTSIAAAACSLGGVALIVLLACGGDSPRRREALAEEPARRLVGAWDATFWLDRPVTLRSALSSPPRRIEGSMAFLEDHVGTPSVEELSDPTHVGVFDIDFSPFGFELRNTNGIPRAVARTVRRATALITSLNGKTMPDSVTIVLDPGTSRFPFRLVGAFTSDSITGTWWAGQALGGGGRFSLHPHRATP